MRRLSAIDGFSLLEVLVSLLVMSVLMTGIAQLLGSTQVRYEADDSFGAQRQAARLVLSRMNQELRLAGYGAEPVGSAFTEATPTSLAMAADLDDGSSGGDCTLESGDDGVERIEYRLADGVFERRVSCWVGGAWTTDTSFQTTANDVVGSVVFRYYDSDGLAITADPAMSATDRDRIVAVEISLELETDTVSDNGEPITFGVSTRVRIRNAELS